MSFLVYIGGTVLASSIATSVASKAVTSAPSAMAGVLNRMGVMGSSTAKSSYKDYYKRMVSDGPLFDGIMKILGDSADKSYAVRQDPRNKDYLSQFSGAPEKWIAADILCFRNATSFYDYSAYGRARVRLYYEDGQAVIMCQKKSEVEEFTTKISNPKFDHRKNLVFLGVG